MKSIKVKFQNKKRKLSRVNSPHDKQKEVKQHQQIGFLLRENTDTQQAKNQLRKVSEEAHDFQNYCQGRVSWDCEQGQRGHSWLDDISDNQVKGVILGKINGNSNLDLRANHKSNIASTLSYGELNGKKRIQLMSRYDINEKTKKTKQYPFLHPEVELRMQGNKKNSQKYKTTNSTQSMNNFYGTMKQMQQIFQDEEDINKNIHSIAELKHKHKIILITPKLNNCNDIEQDKLLKEQISKRQLFNNVYFKVPDFKKEKNIKRSVTVHCQPKIKQSMLLSCKKNFYLKKTNTICVLEKHMEPVNRCISLSNYRDKNIVKGEPEKQSNGMLLTQPKQQLKQIEGTESEERTQENQLRNQQAIKTNLARLSLQKAAKTMMLRQQFQRLRKLLKKQSNYEFKMQEDSPIKITKL